MKMAGDRKGFKGTKTLFQASQFPRAMVYNFDIERLICFCSFFFMWTSMCGTLPFPILFAISCTVPYLHVQFYPMIFDRSGNPVGFGDGLHGLHRLLRSWNPSPRLRHKQMVGCSPMGLGDVWADAGIEIYRYLSTWTKSRKGTIPPSWQRFIGLTRNTSVTALTRISG